MVQPDIYEKLTRYCAYQERWLGDIKKKLGLLKVNKAEYGAYIEKLQQENYLNEERYAKLFVESYTRRKWGKNKIKSALMQKGVGPAVFTKYLQDVDEEDYDAALLKLAERKIKSIKAATAFERKNKLVKFLMGKGYEIKKINEAVKKLL